MDIIKTTRGYTFDDRKRAQKLLDDGKVDDAINFLSELSSQILSSVHKIG